MSEIINGQHDSGEHTAWDDVATAANERHDGLVLSPQEMIENLNIVNANLLGYEDTVRDLATSEGFRKLLNGSSDNTPGLLNGIVASNKEELTDELTKKGVSKIVYDGDSLDFAMKDVKTPDRDTCRDTHIYSFKHTAPDEIRTDHYIVTRDQDGSQNIDRYTQYFSYQTGEPLDMIDPSHYREPKYEGYYDDKDGIKGGFNRSKDKPVHSDPLTAAIQASFK
jgi:hypothetical protein